MNLQERLCDWGNVCLAYQNASRGKRGRSATAAFEMLLADNLLELQKELEEGAYRPGGYNSFYIHEPKKRLISAAPFRSTIIIGTPAARTVTGTIPITPTTILVFVLRLPTSRFTPEMQNGYDCFAEALLMAG